MYCLLKRATVYVAFVPYSGDDIDKTSSCFLCLLCYHAHQQTGLMRHRCLASAGAPRDVPHSICVSCSAHALFRRHIICTTACLPTPLPHALGTGSAVAGACVDLTCHGIARGLQAFDGLQVFVALRLATPCLSMSHPFAHHSTSQGCWRVGGHRREKEKDKEKEKEKEKERESRCSECLEGRPPPFAVSCNNFPVAPFVIHTGVNNRRYRADDRKRYKGGDIEYVRTSLLYTLYI